MLVILKFAFIKETGDDLFAEWIKAGISEVFKAREEEIEETLGLCRFLAYCTSFSAEARKEGAETSRPRSSVCTVL